MMLIRFVWRIIDARTSSRVFREGKWHLQHLCFLPVNRVQRRKNDSLRRRCRSTVRRRNNNLIIIVVVSSLYLLIFPFFSRHVKLDPSTVTNATAPRTLVARTRSTTPPCRRISRRWPAATGAAWKWCNTPEGVSDFVRPNSAIAVRVTKNRVEIREKWKTNSGRGGAWFFFFNCPGRLGMLPPLSTLKL